MHPYDNKEGFDAECEKYYRLAPARNNERVLDDRFMNPPVPQGDGGGGGCGDINLGNTYGLDIRFLNYLGIKEPLVTRVFVANLHCIVDEKKLLEVFKLAGKVLHVELARDKDGKSRGFAIIEYDYPVESVQAISMLHNQRLYDKRMIVRLDRAIEQNTLRKLPEGLKGIGVGLGVGGNRLLNVARNISNIEENNSFVLNLISPHVSDASVLAGMNNILPAQLGDGGSSNLQASLAIDNNAFALQGSSRMDNDVGFGGNNDSDCFNFAAGRDLGDRFNRGDYDRVPGGGGGFAGNQG
ncbi:myelin expression factor 2-like [Bombus pyrosoma]|uniref:myelin expression factor 2-like n=1 Tax=Bombus pyrosoma TaxID=396416 RepID=UPI001CB94692|nr:myelin expression factor 2-like [Bombus pyrosoma]